MLWLSRDPRLFSWFFTVQVSVLWHTSWLSCAFSSILEGVHAQHSILQTSQQYPHLMPHSSFVIVRFFGTLLNIVSSRSSHRLISQIWHGLPDFVGGAAEPSQRDAARASLPARKRHAKDPPCPSLAENTHLNSKKSGNEAWIPRKPEHCTTKVLFL